MMMYVPGAQRLTLQLVLEDIKTQVYFSLSVMKYVSSACHTFLRIVQMFTEDVATPFTSEWPHALARSGWLLPSTLTTPSLALTLPFMPPHNPLKPNPLPSTPIYIIQGLRRSTLNALIEAEPKESIDDDALCKDVEALIAQMQNLTLSYHEQVGSLEDELEQLKETVKEKDEEIRHLRSHAHNHMHTTISFAFS